VRNANIQREMSQNRREMIVLPPHTGVTGKRDELSQITPVDEGTILIANSHNADASLLILLPRTYYNLRVY
jgi:hypothetical protein